MRRLLWLFLFVCGAYCINAQSFEIVGLQENYRGAIGETIKVPIKFKNNSEKAITLIIRKVSNQIGSSQKNYFCIDNNCLDSRTEDYIIKVEPNQVLSSLQVALEAGLAHGISNVKYIAYNKSSPADSFEFDLNFQIEERQEKQSIYTSPHIVLHDVYPNPVSDHAFVNYNLTSDNVKAKITLHNILGNPIEEYPLPFTENKVKIRAETLNPGIYFYTLYVDNEGVMTRKLIVKK